MTYRLKDDGYPFLKIYYGKKWIGRVYKNSQGQWVCQIGTKSYYAASTPQEAFDEGVPRYMGYSSAAALRDQNRKAHERKLANTAKARDLAKRFAASDFKGQMEVIDELFEVAFPKPKENTNA